MKIAYSRRIISFQHEAADYERRYLSKLNENYLSLGGGSWNKVELKNKLISSVIVFLGIETPKFVWFYKEILLQQL